MTALDTNIIVRYLVGDDPRESEAARDLISGLTVKNPGFICREVVLELCWVLKRAYGFSCNRIARVLEELATTAEIQVETAHDVIRSADGYRREGAEISDRLIAAAAVRSGSGKLYTFDKKAAQLSGAVLLE